MPEETKYVIKCSTEEQDRECRDKGLSIKEPTILEEVFEEFGYTIITYDEAKELGLLGERYNYDLVDAIHIGVDMAMEWTESKTLVHQQETPKEENLVEKIMKEIESDNNNVGGAGWVEIPYNILKSILCKHLSYK